MEAIFRDKEWVDFFFLKKKFILKKMIIIIEVKGRKMLKALKHDNKSWNRKTQYFVK